MTKEERYKTVTEGEKKKDLEGSTLYAIRGLQIKKKKKNETPL